MWCYFVVFFWLSFLIFDSKNVFFIIYIFSIMQNFFSLVCQLVDQLVIFIFTQLAVMRES